MFFWLWSLPLFAQSDAMSYGLTALLADCQAQFAAFDEVPGVFSLDLSNGHAEVGGRYPTCGCRCSTTAVALPVSDGSHRFLGRESWDCDARLGLRGADWERVLPADLRSWLLPGAGDSLAPGVVVLDAVLPRADSSLTLKVSLLPLGMEQSCPGRVCDRQGKDLAHVTGMSPYEGWIRRLMDDGMSDSDLEALAQGLDTPLSAEGAALLSAVLSDAEEPARIAFQQVLAQAYARWEWARRLTTTEVPMRWDRENGVLTIDRVAVKQAELTRFSDYLRAVTFYHLSC